MCFVLMVLMTMACLSPPSHDQMAHFIYPMERSVNGALESSWISFGVSVLPLSRCELPHRRGRVPLLEVASCPYQRWCVVSSHPELFDRGGDLTTNYNSAKDLLTYIVLV